MSTVLITGAGGMIGKALIKELNAKGHSVRTLVRDRNKANGTTAFYWNYPDGEIDLKSLDGVDIIISLAGATVSKRWTKRYKEEIYDSRIKSINFLFETIKNKNIPLKQFISVSGTGFYGNTSDQNIKENNPNGNDFLASVCRDWENAANQFSSLGIPVCIFRMGVVMTPDGGFIKQVAAPIKYFVGAHLGSGKQYISWISLTDACRLFNYAIEKTLSGIFNASSSNPMTMEQIDNVIAKFYHRKIWLPNIPGWALKLALGEMAEIILVSCHASNQRIKQAGFTFEIENFEEVLREKSR